MGLTHQAISNWITGRSKPQEKAVQQLIRIFKLKRAEWFEDVPATARRAVSVYRMRRPEGQDEQTLLKEISAQLVEVLARLRSIEKKLDDK